MSILKQNYDFSNVKTNSELISKNDNSLDYLRNYPNNPFDFKPLNLSRDHYVIPKYGWETSLNRNPITSPLLDIHSNKYLKKLRNFKIESNSKSHDVLHQIK